MAPERDTYGMKRTTIMADEELLDDLRRIAREDGVPLAEVIRDALRIKAAQRKPRLKGKGAFRSGLPPVDWNADLAIEPPPWRS